MAIKFVVSIWIRNESDEAWILSHYLLCNILLFYAYVCAYSEAIFHLAFFICRNWTTLYYLSVTFIFFFLRLVIEYSCGLRYVHAPSFRFLLVYSVI